MVMVNPFLSSSDDIERTGSTGFVGRNESLQVAPVPGLSKFEDQLSRVSPDGSITETVAESSPDSFISQFKTWPTWSKLALAALVGYLVYKYFIK